MKKENLNPDPGSAEASDARLASLLRASRPSPSLPPRFQEGVWRRIEDAAAPVKQESWLDAIAALLLRPRFAFATVAVLVLAGTFLGAYNGTQAARQDAQAQYLTAVAPAALR